MYQLWNLLKVCSYISNTSLSKSLQNEESPNMVKHN